MSGGKDDEGGHRQQQEEGDLAASLVDRHREDGAGERDRERGIAGDRDAVQLDETGQPGGVGAVGPGEALEASAGRPTPLGHSMSGGPAAAPDAPPEVPGA
jgi:hypothetical protein